HRGWGFFHDLGYYQNFFQPVQVGGGFDFEGEKRTALGVIADADHSANGKAFGKDSVTPAGDNLFAHVNFLVRHDVVYQKIALASAAQHPLQTRILQDDAGAAIAIADHQNLRTERKHLFYLAHNAVGRDHRHVRLDAVRGAFVDRNDV